MQLTRMTRYTLLGANYGFGPALPVGYVGVDAKINPIRFERSASAFGLGDLTVVPLLLVWHLGD